MAAVKGFADGKTFGSLEDGLAYTQAIGDEELDRRADNAAHQLATPRANPSGRARSPAVPSLLPQHRSVRLRSLARRCAGADPRKERRGILRPRGRHRRCPRTCHGRGGRGRPIVRSPREANICSPIPGFLATTPRPAPFSGSERWSFSPGDKDQRVPSGRPGVNANAVTSAPRRSVSSYASM